MGYEEVKNGLVLTWLPNYSLMVQGVRFKVNGQRIEIYFGHAESANEVIEAYHLDEV